MVPNLFQRSQQAARLFASTGGDAHAAGGFVAAVADQDSLAAQCVALTGACILFVVIVASLLSIRRVLVLEPAAVFRG